MMVTEDGEERVEEDGRIRSVCLANEEREKKRTQGERRTRSCLVHSAGIFACCSFTYSLLPIHLLNKFNRLVHFQNTAHIIGYTNILDAIGFSSQLDGQVAVMALFMEPAKVMAIELE